MKAIAIVCLLAAVLCAAAVQTSESDAVTRRHVQDHLEEEVLQSLLGSVHGRDVEDEEAPSYSESSQVENADQGTPSSGLDLASLKEAAERGDIVINVYPHRHLKHTRTIHRNGHRLKVVGKRLHRRVSRSPSNHGISGKLYRKLIAKIQSVAKDSVRAISALNRKINALKSNGQQGRSGHHGAPGKLGHDGKSVSQSVIKSLNAKIAALRKKVVAADAKLADIHNQASSGVAIAKAAATELTKQIAAMNEKISKLEQSGVPGAPGAHGKDGRDGKDGAPGKSGSFEGKRFVAERIAAVVKEFDAKIAAVSSAAKEGDADALKKIASLSVKLGDQIQSVARHLDAKITQVSKKAGAPGKDGKDGAPGKNGVNGKDGKNGLNGKDGAAGKSGHDGKPGKDGKTGAPGAPGKNGIDGKVGAPGPPGAPGTPGSQGVASLDVCGVNGGNDLTCSRNPGEGSAYSVGDPHFKSWDGATFDIHPSTYWGEYVLFQHKRMHGSDIEVQAATVPWGHNSNREGDASRHGGAKGNTGIAIAAWGNVFVFYARNGCNSFFLNGQSVNWPNSGMTLISPGISASRSGSTFGFHIDNGQGTLKIWGSLQGAHNLDIYGSITGHWATGKSVTGAWGDWNGNRGNDQGIVNTLNAQGKLSVMGTARSYFKNKSPRVDSSGQTLLACDMQLDESQVRIIPGEMMTLEVSGAEKTCPDKADIVAKYCVGTSGDFLKDCEADICLGADPEQSGVRAHMNSVQEPKNNLLGSTGEKDVCRPLNSIKEISAPSGGAKEGSSFSFAAWIKREGLKMSGVIAKRESEWSFTSDVDGKLVFTANGASCTTDSKVLSREWAHVAAVYSGSDKEVRIFVNGEKACSAAVKDAGPIPSGTLQIGSIKDQADAKIGKAYYIVSDIRAGREIHQFVEQKVNCAA